MTLKLALTMVFLVLTGPPTAHALAKAAYLHGLEPERPQPPEPSPATGAGGGEAAPAEGEGQR